VNAVRRDVRIVLTHTQARVVTDMLTVVGNQPVEEWSGTFSVMELQVLRRAQDRIMDALEKTNGTRQ
jgi:hypothetical protein